MKPAYPVVLKPEVVSPRLRSGWAAFSRRELGPLWWRRTGFAPGARFRAFMEADVAGVAPGLRRRAVEIVEAYGRAAFKTQVAPGLVGRAAGACAGLWAGLHLHANPLEHLVLVLAGVLAGSLLAMGARRAGVGCDSQREMSRLAREFEALGSWPE